MAAAKLMVAPAAAVICIYDTNKTIAGEKTKNKDDDID